MTHAELKAEAEKQGYRLFRIPDYQCSCYARYPNKNHKHKNGRWKCINRYEPIEFEQKSQYSPCTRCRVKSKVNSEVKKHKDEELRCNVYESKQ